MDLISNNINPKKKKKGSIKNTIISSYKTAYYQLHEPSKLKRERKKYEKDYINEKHPLISVYTPTYNRGKTLMERALPSVLSQTYENIEYIIIGDCCTDDTTELVSSVDDKRIRYYNIPKRGYRYPPSAVNNWLVGPVFAANTALRMVKG